MWSCRKMGGGGVIRGRTGEEWEGKGCGIDVHPSCYVHMESIKVASI